MPLLPPLPASLTRTTTSLTRLTVSPSGTTLPRTGRVPRDLSDRPTDGMMPSRPAPRPTTRSDTCTTRTRSRSPSSTTSPELELSRGEEDSTSEEVEEVEEVPARPGEEPTRRGTRLEDEGDQPRGGTSRGRVREDEEEDEEDGTTGTRYVQQTEGISSDPQRRSES